MPGTMWFPFRQGARSEYLAHYILSAIGISIYVPRTEDIGVDFYCSLAKKNEKRMTFHSPFIVQVKSNSEKEVSYGGPDKKSRWKKEEIDWLFSQELPLLIGIADKNELRLNLYSTSNMWGAMYSEGNTGQVVLQPDKWGGNDGEVKIPTSTPMPEWPSGMGDGKKWLVPLGPPLISIAIGDVEDDAKITQFGNILSTAVRIEQANITYRRLGVHWAMWPMTYKTNKSKWLEYGSFFTANTTPGANTEKQLQSLLPIIACLVFNYKCQNKLSEIEKFKPIMALMPEGGQLQTIREKVPELFE